MTLEQLKNILTDSINNPSLELRESTVWLVNAMKTLCAFLNGQGGMVVFGVNEKKRIIGQELDYGLNDKIQLAISRISPHAAIDCHYIKCKSDKYVITIEAKPLQSEELYTYHDRAYAKLKGQTVRVPKGASLSDIGFRFASGPSILIK